MNVNQLILLILILTIINSLSLAFNIGATMYIFSKVDSIDLSLLKIYSLSLRNKKNNSLDPKLYTACYQAFRNGKTHANMNTAFNEEVTADND